MKPSDGDIADDLSRPPADLGRHATHGFVWLMAQTIGVKLVSLAANVVLAWLLVPGDAGLVGMAYTVMSIAGIVQYIGMQDVLVQRQSRFRRWANPAFWMLLAVGLAGGGIVALAAPVAAKVYGEPRLVGLICTLAAASPFQTTSIVPQALLASQLRFRTAVIIGASAAVGTSLLSVIFGAMGLGPYSFVLPIPIIAALHAAALWWFAPVRIRRRPQLRRWRFLIGDTGYNWGTSVSLIIMTTADHVVLGILFSKEVVGVYFWAVNLSTQLLRLLATNLTSVLLPSLSRLSDDPARQTAAFINSMRILALVGIPACLLQAAIARPLVDVLYDDRWLDVGPVLAVLSAGLAFYFVSGPATSIMKARGEFGGVFLLHAVNAACMVGIVTWIALSSSPDRAALNVATGASLCLACFGPLYVMFAARSAGGRTGLGAVLRVYGWPTLAGTASIALGMGAASLLPEMRLRAIAEIGVTAVAAGGSYLLLIRLLDPADWSAARLRLQSLVRRR